MKQQLEEFLYSFRKAKTVDEFIDRMTEIEYFLYVLGVNLKDYQKKFIDQREAERLADLLFFVHRQLKDILVTIETKDRSTIEEVIERLRCTKKEQNTHTGENK